MGYTDRTREYQACVNFLEVISPNNKGKTTDKIIDLISSDDNPKKMEILCVETKQGGKQMDSTGNEATQEEHEKLEDDNNN